MTSFLFAFRHRKQHESMYFVLSQTLGLLYSYRCILVAKIYSSEENKKMEAINTGTTTVFSLDKWQRRRGVEVYVTARWRCLIATPHFMAMLRQ
jgi:hypothetical protein